MYELLEHTADIGLRVRAAGDRFRETAGLIVPPLVFLACSLWLGIATPSILHESWSAAANALFGLH